MISTDTLHFSRFDYDTSDTSDLACGVTVRLRKGAGRELKRGGLWIYDNELDPASLPSEDDASFTNGSIVRVEDFDGWFLGCGFLCGLFRSELFLH